MCVFVIPIENKLTDAISIAALKRSFGSSYSAPLREVKAWLSGRRGAVWPDFPYIHTSFLSTLGFCLERGRFSLLNLVWLLACGAPVALVLFDHVCCISHLLIGLLILHKHGRCFFSGQICSFLCSPVSPDAPQFIPCAICS